MIGPEVFTLVTTGAGAVVAVVGGWQARRRALADADRLACLVATHPCRGLPPGSGRVVEGEILAGLDQVPVLPAPGRLERGVSPQVRQGEPAGRPAALVSAPSCHGTLTRHRDGTTSCHNGRDDCLGAESGHTHRRTVSCADLSHGCGVCDVIGGVL